MLLPEKRLERKRAALPHVLLALGYYMQLRVHRPYGGAAGPGPGTTSQT